MIQLTQDTNQRLAECVRVFSAYVDRIQSTAQGNPQQPQPDEDGHFEDDDEDDDDNEDEAEYEDVDEEGDDEDENGDDNDNDNEVHDDAPEQGPAPDDENI
jgi:hypothetical protein